MNRLLDKVFTNRGYTKEYLESINVSDHGLLKDIDLLSERLYDIYTKQTHIVILPDFDMDGIMSGVIGFAGLAELGFNVSLFIPDPKKGYGFDAKTISDLINQYPDVGAIITCDVGISAIEGTDAAFLAGIEVLITDHHKQDVINKNASVIVNPMRLDESYENPAICGAYVLHQCLQYYADKYCDVFTKEQINRLRVFAGIGTVSDSMPILYENRQVVKDAISICRLVYSDNSDFIINNIVGSDIYRRAFRGLYNILVVFEEIGKISSYHDITEDLFGYYIAPTFNSVKRLSGDLQKAFDVFFGVYSVDSVHYLVELNERRKELVAEKYAELFNIDQPFKPYVYISDAPAGILGLLAQKIRTDTGLPALVLNQDNKKYKGSGRCPMWYPFLDRVKPEGFWAAGHNPAFGVGFTDKKELEAFLAFFEKDVSDLYKELELDKVTYEPDFIISTDNSGDANIDVLLFAEYLYELSRYKPFGQGFRKPESVLRFHSSQGVWEVIGKENQHLKITLSYGFSVLLWNQAYLINNKDAGWLEVTGELNRSYFNDTSTINFVGNLHA